MGQGDGNPVLLVPQPNGLGKFHLLYQLWHERSGQGHDSVFAAFGPDEKEGELFQIQILDSQIEGLRDPQAAAINQAGDQIGGVTGTILHGLEQGLGFRHGGRMTQASRSSGAESIDALKRFVQDFLVKIENGVERLILAAGGQITVAGQVGEEEFEFLLAGQRSGHGVESGDILAEPMDVGGFSGESHVLAAQDIAELFDGEMQIHNTWKFDRAGGTKAVQGKKLDKRTGSSFIDFGFVDYETLAGKCGLS